MGIRVSLTLEAIAHFDRCMFPDELEQDLIKVGLDQNDAAVIRQTLIGRRSCGGQCSVVQLYQEFIDSIPITRAIDSVVSNFAYRHRYPQTP